MEPPSAKDLHARPKMKQISDGSLQSSSRSSRSTRDSSSNYGSRSTVPSTAPSINQKFVSAQEHHPEIHYDKPEEEDPSASSLTYQSTVPSIEEEEEEQAYVERHQQDGYFDQPVRQTLFNDASPADPTRFARLFPYRKSFIIKHDDAVVDGHMNLRMDTTYERPGHRNKKLTMFYLRMYELQRRHFAIRRYGRDCGREVASTSRKYQKPSSPRPGLLRTVSKAFAKDPEVGIKRQDSGYESSEEEEPRKDEATATNICTLEFSNYARIDLCRKGQKGSKKYDFEYWGKQYCWKRTVRKGGINDHTTFSLIDIAENNTIATISPLEDDGISIEDRARRRFVPASELRFTVAERDMQKASFIDLADVVVATGLTALVDDCIKRQVHKKKGVQFALPLPSKSPVKMHLEYVGAKRIIDEVFKWSPSRPSTPTSGQQTPTRPSPIKSHTSPILKRLTPIRAHTSPPQMQHMNRSPIYAQ